MPRHETPGPRATRTRSRFGSMAARYPGRRQATHSRISMGHAGSSFAAFYTHARAINSCHAAAPSRKATRAGPRDVSVAGSGERTLAQANLAALGATRARTYTANQLPDGSGEERCVVPRRVRHRRRAAELNGTCPLNDLSDAIDLGVRLDPECDAESGRWQASRSTAQASRSPYALLPLRRRRPTHRPLHVWNTLMLARQLAAPAPDLSISPQA